MLRTTIYHLAGTIAVVTAMPSAAAVQTVISTGSVADSSGRATVELSFLNSGDPVRFEPPARLSADLDVSGHHGTVTLEREGNVTPTMLAATSFARATYTVALPAGTRAATLSLANGAGFALPLARDDTPAQLAAESAPPLTQPADRTGPPGTNKVVVVEQSFGSPRADTGNAFLGNLSAYLPIYAVYGPGTSTDAKIQISFKYQLFGKAGAAHSWFERIDFGYTQRLYWDLGATSAPFRNVDYNPELMYVVPAPARLAGVAFGGTGGIAHESNGRDGTASRSTNYLYIQPVATLTVGDYKLSVGPRLWTYVGDLGDNPDIVRYRGNTGLFAEIGRDNGLRVSTNSRLNFGSGKGAFEAEVSYPLNRWLKSLNLYVFGQGFTGYGENLLDYNRHANRLRIGVGLVR